MLAVLALMSFVPLHLTTRTYWLEDATPQANALTKHLSQLVEAKSWVDVFATNDPVSNGPLYRDIPPSGPVSKEVVNRRSFLNDHTTYWENDAEFLPTVACSLQRGAGLRVIAPADCPAMQAAVVRYRWCVGWLAVNWWAALTGLATVAVAVFAGKLALAPWGDATQAALGSIPLGVKGLADGFVNLADVLVAWVGGCAKCGAGKIALGFLPPLAVIVLLKMAFVQAWRLWARETAWQALTDRRVASAPVSAPSPGADGTITAATDPRRVEAPSVGGKLPIGTLGNIAVISLAAMPLVLSLAWVFVKPEQVLRVFLWILGGLVVLAMSITLGGLVVQLKEQARALRASGGRGFGVWRDIVIVVVMLAAVLTAIVSYVPGAPTWLPPLIIMVMSGLLFLLFTLAAWANLFGRFEGAAWKALTISVPLLIGAGLSKSTLLRSKASPEDALATAPTFGVLTVPVFGVLLGLGLIWLIATLARRRVQEAHRRDASPPEG
jgi:hypothetical protein